ncbi:MAG TPA: hypothetical protein DCF45_03375, partial [Gammaproteobacteria bacterium]|nr:hypothetical protein [Gammaproteobacteria bacterium]
MPVGLLLVQSGAHAAPQGGAIVGGQGSISAAGNVTSIQQNSARLVAEWNTFNVDSGELVKFLQPSSSAIALNRILDQNPSQILGSIEANGRLVLANPNGLIFAPGASVNVGALVASGLDITASDFMNGELSFSSLDSGVVINRGLIQAASGGSVSLIGGSVINEGTIIADLGQVNLGAGTAATLDFDGDGLIQFAVSGELTTDLLSEGVAVSNRGTIQSRGGTVLLQAQAAHDVFSQVVNNSGVIKAGGIDTQGGSVRLVGSGKVTNSGLVDVSADTVNGQAGVVSIVGDQVTHSGAVIADVVTGVAGEVALEAEEKALIENGVISAQATGEGQGGTVAILGHEVELIGESVVNVSGVNGGGTILVGGDYRGGNTAIQNSLRTLVSQQSRLYADAITSGDGGTVIVWSDDTTEFYGQLSARGGESSGDGGFAEISGKSQLFINDLT